MYDSEPLAVSSSPPAAAAAVAAQTCLIRLQNLYGRVFTTVNAMNEAQWITTIRTIPGFAVRKMLCPF